MTNTIQVDAEQLGYWLEDVLVPETWLFSGSGIRHTDEELLFEAENFLLSVAEEGLTEWGDTSQAIKEVIPVLMGNFLGKLIHPDSSFASRSWTADSSATPFDNVMSIVAYEIRHNPRCLREK